jgi:short-subunit dehydrogenase
MVTGASSGIGAAVARSLAREGMLVILLARRVERLDELAREIRAAGGEVETLPADISLEKERKRVFDRVTDRFGRLDLLVNNAGMGYYGFAAEMPWQTASEILAVNISAIVHLCLLFLPGMKQRGNGQVINISSIAGKMPNQGIAVYSGSKSFLDSFSTSLFREMRGSGVFICTLRPGPVSSEFFDTAQERSNGNRRTPGELFAIAPERVARAVIGLVNHPRRKAYVPAYLVVSPLLELLFGWAIDLVGPVLLKRKSPLPLNGIK